jgi:hypothetical protein
MAASGNKRKYDLIMIRSHEFMRMRPECKSDEHSVVLLLIPVHKEGIKKTGYAQ